MLNAGDIFVYEGRTVVAVTVVRGVKGYTRIVNMKLITEAIKHYLKGKYENQ